MRTVRDDSGEKFLLLKRSTHSSLLRDPNTGESCSRPNTALELLDSDPLAVAGAAIPEEKRATLGLDVTTLGLLLEVARRAPLPVRELPSITDACEQDLNGMAGELRAAGHLEERTVAGVSCLTVCEKTRAELDARL